MTDPTRKNITYFFVLRAEDIVKEKLNMMVRIALLHVIQGEKSEPFLEKLNKMIYGKEHSYAINWNEFYILINVAYDNFVTRLQYHYPEIKEKEMQLFCLLLLKVSMADIAFLLDYSIHTIRKWRTDLRKKFCMPEGADIVDFIRQQF